MSSATLTLLRSSCFGRASKHVRVAPVCGTELTVQPGVGEADSPLEISDSSLVPAAGTETNKNQEKRK